MGCWPGQARIGKDRRGLGRARKDWERRKDWMDRGGVRRIGDNWKELGRMEKGMEV